jgi:flagellar biosynthetic protein FliR
MNFTAAEINALVGSYIWPMFRIGAVVATAPIFGARYIPNRVKILFVLALTVVIAPSVPQVPAIDPLSLPALAIIVQQLLIGAVTGLLMAMVLGAFIIGGEIIATSMGLGFASVVDPQMGVQTPVVSQFYVILLSLVFVSINGHLLLIHELSDSFQTMPIAADGLARDTFWNLVAWADVMLKTAVLMALPAVTTLFIVNLALGIVMRAAPQFNILNIGFPVTLIIGFIVMVVTLPVVVPQFVDVLETGFEAVRALLPRAP